MLVRLATEPAHDSAENEDFVGATPNAIVLLDGAGSAGAESGCVHGVAWYTRHLGTALLAELAAPNAESLQDALRRSIDAVADRHGGQCDLTHPGTPSATVILTRIRGDALEYLVLADSVLIIDAVTGLRIVCDDREANVGEQYRHAMDSSPNGTPEHARALTEYISAMRKHRNQPGGFWVASTDAAAADEALTGEIPASEVHALALLSDGASRLVDRFQLANWPDVMRTLADAGPAHLIHQNRLAERSDPDGARWPRGKLHDDATAAYVTL